MRHLLSFVFFMAGLFTIAVGSVCMIMAGIGLPPWDVLHTGLTKTWGLTFGIWSQIRYRIEHVFYWLLD
ncbi:hypothetical protein [Cohnella kolymensis]|uniref:hypothetical protein n=1 Tax=Cohnella kolymensis TaxID=1590652 RepID=UPI000696A1F1|nr:hypothetical protein [Cohnella kolymensis]